MYLPKRVSDGLFLLFAVAAPRTVRIVMYAEIVSNLQRMGEDGGPLTADFCTVRVSYPGVLPQVIHHTRRVIGIITVQQVESQLDGDNGDKINIGGNAGFERK